MSRKFRDDYGVYVCSHVFENKAPVLEGVRDSDGCWQLFCGGEHDFELEEPRLVGMGCITSRDETVHELTKLNAGEFAVRNSLNDTWQYGVIDE
ncbi:hypothetical protein QFX18_19225 [Saccharophagus degradans]|uniref:hypothetical protein n=1 Tax=Saccharophagus degradans TaxID=86304 RepID=UPI002477F094|nr:hypothetical protein [Saccharophagus degradans]WGO98142.1 hypothetical protein QFX18_19225 [Saccharophagus degradans]